MINEQDLDETVGLLSTLIQNKCVNPPGNELRSIKSIEEFLTKKGIESQVFESTSNRGDLVARIKGTKDGAPSLMFGPSHVDVVPVPNPEAWEVDPFSGTVKDGYIWGRGALDMLFIVVAQVQAFAKLSEENFQPKGDLVLFIVADEEAGGLYGVEWMFKNHPNLIQTDYAVSEIAGGLSLSPGRITLQIGEKGGSWKRIFFKGTPGHGSMPFASDNAINKAAKAVNLLTDYCDNKIPITTEYLSYLANGLGLGLISRFFMTNKRMIPSALRRLRKSNPQMAKLIHSLSRMTIAPNIVKGGTKVNVIAANAYIDVDIRTLPGQDETYIITHLNKALGNLANEAEIQAVPPEEGGVVSYGNASPAKSDFVTAMEKAIQQEIPNAKFVPFIMPGSSDARFFRERNIATYGFALLDPETPMSHLTTLPHGTNERIGIKTVDLTLRAHYNLAKEFLS
ncbi:MAG: M20/M25/M40 family metallo-hydrolase [Promethearchaeota archaeon]